jgi:hypothetical protein
MCMHFRTFRLQPPYAPPFRQYFVLQAGFAADSLLLAIGGRSDFVHSKQSRQSQQAVSSLCRNAMRHRSSTDYPFTSSCSPPRVATAQFPSVTRREAPPVRDFHSLCTLTLKRTLRALYERGYDRWVYRRRKLGADLFQERS